MQQYNYYHYAQFILEYRHNSPHVLLFVCLKGDHTAVNVFLALTQEEGGGLLLSNPVACGSISPGGPMTGSSTSSHHHSSHPHNHHPHHPPSRTSPPSSSNTTGLSQSLNYSHSSSSTPVNSITRGASGERSSFGKGKNRSKSPALLRFFVRGSGGSRKTSEVEEEDYASSGSDHEDPFSVSLILY